MLMSTFPLTSLMSLDGVVPSFKLDNRLDESFIYLLRLFWFLLLDVSLEEMYQRMQEGLDY